MKLIPFEGYSPALQPALQLQGTLRIEEHRRLVLQFQWNPEFPLRGIPRSTSTPGGRSHDLWKTTCFEAFVLLPAPAPPSASTSEGAYLEINVAPDGRWNAYAFEQYRTPAPPREAPDWKLLELACRPGSLRAVLECGPENLKGGRVGITAVIEDETGQLSYWALAHAAAKPDFHDVRSFVLEL